MKHDRLAHRGRPVRSDPVRGTVERFRGLPNRLWNRGERFDPRIEIGDAGQRVQNAFIDTQRAGRRLIGVAQLYQMPSS
jgi:hypothetical protein